MELVAGFLLWVADVFGVKWVRGEPNKFKKLVKVITYLIVGFILLVIFLVWYS